MTSTRIALVAAALALPMFARAQQQAAAAAATSTAGEHGSVTATPAPPVSEPAAATSPLPAQAAVQTDTVTVVGARIPAGRATTEVNAPFDVVSAVVMDLGRYRDFLPQVRESRVIRRHHGAVDLYVQVQLLRNLGTLWALSRFVIQHSATTVVADGQLVEGNVNRFDIRVSATPIAGTRRTRLVFQLLGIPTSLFPDALMAPQQSRWAGRALAAMRDRAESIAAAHPASPAAAASARAPRAGGPARGAAGGGPAPSPR